MNEINVLIGENFSVDEATEVREKIHHLMGQGERHFVFNFSNCTFIDSTGLGVLVGIYKKCAELNGGIKLHSINPKVMRVFELTRLDKVFEIVK